MIICPTCEKPVDAFGNVIEPQPHESQRTLKGPQCVPCRIEAIRKKRYGEKPSETASLPYKD